MLVRDGSLMGGNAGSIADATNNIAELTAAIEGLGRVLRDDMRFCTMGVQEPVVLVSDSEYTVGCAEGAFPPTANAILANRLCRIFKRLGATGRHVDGHSGDEFNEMCDRWAGLKRKAAIKKGGGKDGA